MKKVIALLLIVVIALFVVAFIFINNDKNRIDENNHSSTTNTPQITTLKDAIDHIGHADGLKFLFMFLDATWYDSYEVGLHEKEFFVAFNYEKSNIAYGNFLDLNNKEYETISNRKVISDFAIEITTSSGKVIELDLNDFDYGGTIKVKIDGYRNSDWHRYSSCGLDEEYCK